MVFQVRGETGSDTKNIDDVLVLELELQRRAKSHHYSPRVLLEFSKQELFRGSGQKFPNPVEKKISPTDTFAQRRKVLVSHPEDLCKSTQQCEIQLVHC